MKRMLLPTRLGLQESHTNKQEIIDPIYKNAAVAIFDELSKQIWGRPYLFENDYVRSADNKESWTKLTSPTHPLSKLLCKPITIHMVDLSTSMGLFWDNCPIIIFFRVRHGPTHPFPQVSRFLLKKSPLQQVGSATTGMLEWANMQSALISNCVYKYKIKLERAGLTQTALQRDVTLYRHLHSPYSRIFQNEAATALFENK